MLVVDPIGWLCFFVGAAVDSADWPYFGAVVGLAVGRAVGLAIGGAILTGADVAVGFSRLSLVGSNKPSKMLDCQYRFSGILFLKIAFPQNQIVEPWQLPCC